MFSKSPQVGEAGQALYERFTEFAVARSIGVTDDLYIQLHTSLNTFVKAVAAELGRLDSEVEHLKARR